MFNVSSGNSAISTSGAGNVTLITTRTIASPITFAVIINTGTVDAQYSTDSGVVWFALPASSSVAVDFERAFIGSIIARRVGGTDATGLWAYGFYEQPG